MNQKGFTHIIAIVVGIITVAGVMSYLILSEQLPSLFSLPWPSESSTAPLNFPSPSSLVVASPITECKADSDCPSSRYSCEMIQGEGVVYPDKNQPSAMSIIKGVCKLKEGSQCSANTDCAGGFLCHDNACVSPIGRQCGGVDDRSCSGDYECVQGCGPPVMRQGDDYPISYFCQLKGYVRSCPICLAEDTLIDTPSGAISVQNLQKGMDVWTLSRSGVRIALPILETSRSPVPLTHRVIQILLDDGRQLFASPGHPTGDGRTIGGLAVGDMLDLGQIISIKSILYQKLFTYDLLPAGGTATYWANGILVGSTLTKR